jgi:hypothetical protein
VSGAWVAFFRSAPATAAHSQPAHPHTRTPATAAAQHSSSCNQARRLTSVAGLLEADATAHKAAAPSVVAQLLLLLLLLLLLPLLLLPLPLPNVRQPRHACCLN